MKTNKRILPSVLFLAMLSWLLFSQDRAQISQQNPRSQQSMEDELAALRAIATANKKAIEDNRALSSTSDATKLLILNAILDALKVLLPMLITAAPLFWKLKRNDAASAARNVAVVEKVEAVAAQNVDLTKKTSHIETLTNSTASELVKTNAVLQERNIGLEKLLASFLEREKVDLAKQQMPPGTAVSSPPPAPSPAANGQTDRIEKTGEDTNVRAQNIETHVEHRVQKVEDKLDAVEKEKEKT